MWVVVFASADIHNYDFCKNYVSKADFIISCDGGMRHTKKLNIIPNCIMGDFDSVDRETYDYYKLKNIEFKTFPTRKDFTDTELGLNYALDIGASDITIIGGIGSRLDHTLANIQILVKAVDKGANIRLVNENNELIVIKDEIEIIGKKGDLVSLLPLGLEAKSIYTSGLEYPLNGENLTVGTARGVSNVMIGNIAKVTVGEGYLLVIKSND